MIGGDEYAVGHARDDATEIDECLRAGWAIVGFTAESAEGHQGIWILLIRPRPTTQPSVP